MSRLLAHPILRDARHYQIAVLSTLVVYNLGWLDFGARPLNSASAIGGALATQVVCSRLFVLPSIDLRSPLITGLSLSLLLRADDAWVHLARRRDRHRLEIPVADRRQAHLESGRLRHRGAAVSASSHVWISPGSWGSTVWFAALLAFFAILVLRRRAPLRHRDLLPRQPRRAAAGARRLARRSARHPAASDCRAARC